MDLGLKDKVVLVTGSSRGIGKAIASLFLEEGARVIITGREADSLNQAYEQFSRRYGERNVVFFQGDMTQMTDIRQCVEEATRTLGRIDILVANVGTGKSKVGLEADRAEWERMLHLNLLGGVEVVRAVVPMMVANSGGSMVFIASIVGVEATAVPLGYAAAKAGLLSLSKNLSRELAQYNIRVNAVAPGNVLFAGGRWEEIMREKPNIMEDYIRPNVPMGRLGQPEEVAAAVVFLASERASFITGVCLIVDGGETRSFP